MRTEKRHELQKVYTDIFGGTLVPHLIKFDKSHLDLLDGCHYYTELTGYGTIEMTEHTFIFRPFAHPKIEPIKTVHEVTEDTREFYIDC